MRGIKEDKNIALTIFLIMVLILGMGGISYFIYEIAFINQENNSGEQKTYTLDVYKNDYGLCLEKYSNCTLAFSIETEAENAVLLTKEYEKNSFVLYRDNGLKLYNATTGEIKKVNLSDDYKDYRIYLNNAKNKISGIIYTLQDGSLGYYNVLKDLNLYEGMYTYFYYLDENYLLGSNSLNTFLLSSNTEKEELSTNKNSSYSLSSYNGKYYFFEHEDPTSEFITKIYNNNKQVIFDSKITSYKKSVVDGILYLADNEVVKKV